MMPASDVVILGWKLEDYYKKNNLKLPSKIEYLEIGDDALEYSGIRNTFISDSDVAKAQIEALKKAGIISKYVEVDHLRRPNPNGRYIYAVTPEGNREFSKTCLEIFGDIGEMRERYPEDFVIGIELSSRYFPTYLDWKEEHGVLPLIDFSEISPLIEIFRREVMKYNPDFAEAGIFVKTIWY